MFCELSNGKQFITCQLSKKQCAPCDIFTFYSPRYKCLVLLNFLVCWTDLKKLRLFCCGTIFLQILALVGNVMQWGGSLSLGGE